MFFVKNINYRGKIMKTLKIFLALVILLCCGMVWADNGAFLVNNGTTLNGSGTETLYYSDAEYTQQTTEITITGNTVIYVKYPKAVGTFAGFDFSTDNIRNWNYGYKGEDGDYHKVELYVSCVNSGTGEIKPKFTVGSETIYGTSLAVNYDDGIKYYSDSALTTEISSFDISTSSHVYCKIPNAAISARNVTGFYSSNNNLTIKSYTGSWVTGGYMCDVEVSPGIGSGTGTIAPIFSELNNTLTSYGTPLSVSFNDGIKYYSDSALTTEISSFELHWNTQVYVKIPKSIWSLGSFNGIYLSTNNIFLSAKYGTEWSEDVDYVKVIVYLKCLNTGTGELAPKFTVNNDTVYGQSLSIIYGDMTKYYRDENLTQEITSTLTITGQTTIYAKVYNFTKNLNASFADEFESSNGNLSISVGTGVAGNDHYKYPLTLTPNGSGKGKISPKYTIKEPYTSETYNLNGTALSVKFGSSDLSLTSSTHTITDGVLTAVIGDEVVLTGNVSYDQGYSWSKSANWSWNKATFTYYNNNCYITCKDEITASDNYVVTFTDEYGDSVSVQLVVEPMEEEYTYIKLFEGDKELTKDINNIYTISGDVGTEKQIIAKVYVNDQEVTDSRFNKVTWNANMASGWNNAARYFNGRNAYIKFKNKGEGGIITVASKLCPDTSISCKLTTTLTFNSFTFDGPTTVKKGATISLSIKDTPISNYKVKSLPMTEWSTCRPITDGKKIYFTGKKVGEYTVPVTVSCSGVDCTQNITITVTE